MSAMIEKHGLLLAAITLIVTLSVLLVGAGIAIGKADKDREQMKIDINQNSEDRKILSEKVDDLTKTVNTTATDVKWLIDNAKKK